jgi:hypothetical protein
MMYSLLKVPTQVLEIRSGSITVQRYLLLHNSENFHNIFTQLFQVFPIFIDGLYKPKSMTHLS